MRQLSIKLIIFSILLMAMLPAEAVVKGGIDYTIPIDYSKLSRADLEQNAKKYFQNSSSIKNGEIDNNTTQALVLYSMLNKMDPYNEDYLIKLGQLYEKIDRDRIAKGCFSQAISINQASPTPYFYLGEYYYNKKSYRKALKYYDIAYQNGYNNNYSTLYKLGILYEKFGDTRKSLQYLNMANSIKPSEDLENIIRRVINENTENMQYYAN